jgi:ParB family chromosome partitioning protein
MTRRTGLGRGLDALIPGGETPSSAGISQIPVDQIDPNPRQPRSHFDADEIEELAASVR